MKLALALGCLVTATTALTGESYDCKETAYSKENYSWGAGNVTLKIKSKDEITLSYESKGKTITTTANRDKHFKKNTTTVRFIDSDKNIADAESGETGVFVGKGLLEGESHGSLELTSNQANDGDSGGQYIWNTEGQFSCK